MTIEPGTRSNETSRSAEEILTLLRSAGLRPTRQRLALTRLLLGGQDRHVSAEVLHAEVVAQVGGVRTQSGALLKVQAA